MYSEALTIMDRNTALLMCEEQARQIEEMADMLMQKDDIIAALRAENERLRQQQK